LDTAADFLVKKGMVGSPYYAYFLLYGLYSANRGQDALDFLISTQKNSWMTMLKNGATTTSEMWSIDEKPNMSWSHPWAATPVAIISQNLMGIYPTSQTYNTVAIKPQIANLQYAVITTPTIKGPITVKVTNTKKTYTVSEYKVEVWLPANIIADVYLPEIENQKNCMFVDGTQRFATTQERFILAQNIGSGYHEILLKSFF